MQVSPTQMTIKAREASNRNCSGFKFSIQSLDHTSVSKFLYIIFFLKG